KSPESWRLVNNNKKDGQEIVFTLQGLIQDKNLPDRKINPGKAHLLQQAVTLTGLGTETFESSMDALCKMHTIFSRQFPEGKLAPWQPVASAWTTGRGLVLTNRYFTRRSEANTMPSIPFSEGIDPRGILKKMLNNKMIHTEENEVKYYTRYADMARFRYITSLPQIFRVGDLVEVQFSLVVYKMRDEQYILKPMLYAIALLD
ncbi:hypothetical protein BDN72DRAFT_722105, partial [Pluteus cervinus]